MSADYDDDDVWDEPVIDVVTENKIIELDITTISKTELTQIQEMAKYASNQKLQKFPQEILSAFQKVIENNTNKIL